MGLLHRKIPLVLALLVGAGCSKHGLPAPGGGTLSPSKVMLFRNVEVTYAQQKPLTYRVETVGILEAEGTTDIAAGLNGVVDGVFFREGDEVQPGTLLVTIDQTRYQAEADLAQANVQRAKANLDLAKDLADRAERAGLGTSEEEKVKTRGLLRVAEADLRSSQAALTKAQHNLDRSRVRAPYAGRINKRLVTRGTYLEEKGVIATMADLSRIRLVGYVPESAAPILRQLLRSQDSRLDLARLGLALAGNPVSGPGTLLTNLVLLDRDYLPSGFDPEFELHALPGETFLGRIFYMSTTANLDTHMFETKAEVLGWTPPISSPASLRRNFEDPKLWPGFTAKIRFPLRSSPNSCVIPEEAVRASERGFIAFVPEKQKRADGQFEWVARARVLDLGYRAHGWVEVRQGLSIGELLVRRGAEALEDGTPIQFKQ